MKYSLDNIFAPGTSTHDIYAATTQNLMTKLVSGFNSTMFAYGQTSSGKTHTMRGTPSEPGIINLAVHEVFSIIEANQEREFLLRVSYMEVRCEGLRLAHSHLELGSKRASMPACNVVASSQCKPGRGLP